MSDSRPEFQALEQELWKLDDDKSFPKKRPLLAHYTSLATLEKIAGNKELWLSHPYLMNDHQELAWALEEGVRRALVDAELTRILGSTAGSFADILVQLSDADASSHNLDIYLACFSEHVPCVDSDGVLSMWRAYGGGGSGAALIFDTSELDPDEDSPFILAPVSYYSTEERIGFIDWAIRLVANAAEELDELNDEVLYELAWIYYHRLRMFALFTKHLGFREENEWRLVYDPKRDDWEEYAEHLSYSISERGIEPKLKLRFGSSGPMKDVSFDKLLSSVLLGPTAASALSLHATKRMLISAGCVPLSEKVRASSTPLRRM